MLLACKEYVQNGQEFTSAWENMLGHSSARLLSNEELNVIKRLGGDFGFTDCEGEITRLEYIGDMLKSLYEKRCKYCSNQGKTYISVGFMTGAIIMIFIL